MYKTCNTEHTAQRQQQLEDHLLKNMLSTPYAEISISDLCLQASISRKSFYRYFDNKDACLCALLDRVLMDYSSFSVSVPDEFQGAAKELFQILSYWKEQADLLRVLISNNLADRLLERIMVHMRNEERPVFRQMGVNLEDYPEQLLFGTSGYVSILLYWAQSGFRKSVSEMTDILTPLLTRPLMPDFPSERSADV